MNDLFQDTWQELREKRLWPIALVLVLAIVAVPALLTKSAAQPPAAAPVVAESEADERIAVQLDGEDAAAGGSLLDKFQEGDPFTPPAAIAKRSDTATATSASVTGPTSGAPTGGGGGGDDGGPPSSPAPDGPAPAPPTTRTETSEYEYVVDATFWNGDRRRAIRGLRKLDMLPSQRAPVLIFMGTVGDGGNAVFLVDSTLRPAGEGRCVPGPANCVYVHLGPGSEHAFTTEAGDSYRLRVDEIRRVEVKPRSSSARRPSARGSSGAAGARRFQLPSLVDLVAVTEETVQGAAPPSNRSSAAKGGR
jgi:hypothetical protein